MVIQPEMMMCCVDVMVTNSLSGLAVAAAEALPVDDVIVTQC
jgi:hypothetical protein